MIYFLIENKPCDVFERKIAEGKFFHCWEYICIHAEKNKNILNFEPCIFFRR